MKASFALRYYLQLGGGNEIAGTALCVRWFSGLSYFGLNEDDSIQSLNFQKKGLEYEDRSSEPLLESVVAYVKETT